MMKTIFILLMLLLPTISFYAQNPVPRDTAVVKTLTEDPDDMARAAAEQKKAEEKLRQEMQANREARTERKLNRIYRSVGMIALILVVAIIVKKRKGKNKATNP